MKPHIPRAFHALFLTVGLLASAASIQAAEYLVVDLTTGASRISTAAPNLADDTCRTTELWLRRIPAGTFVMGSPEPELGRFPDETQYTVTLTNDYYIGVFEVTQAQWDAVMGAGNPRNALFIGATRPRECVAWDEIRGTLASTTFMGKLRTLTGLGFDLPTEAQWEYACRAETTTALSNGQNLTSTDQDAALNDIARYGYNQSDGRGGYSERHTKVGSYAPNAWGLYDMHGNVWECCLDWYGDYATGAITDPNGPAIGEERVQRGGGCGSPARGCRSALRFAHSNTVYSDGGGFRLALGCVPATQICLAKPVAGSNAVAMFNATQYTGVVSWSPALSGGKFSGNMVYTATITLTPKSGYTFNGTPANAFSIPGATSVTNAAGSGVVTAVFPATGVMEYLVVNLTTGASRISTVAPNLANDTCRTTELWLRRIPAGTFVMGSPETELGRFPYETQHTVTLTKDYYIGVFEVTQAQWDAVMGAGNPRSACETGATRPRELVTWDEIRGTLGTTTFMGNLRALTGLEFDLPTEAQWEYACRAGTTTALNNGQNLTDRNEDAALNDIARYGYNQSDGRGGYSEYHTKVGSYAPNAWGLYDMHGNVYEWCLDWWGDYATGAVTDPNGPSTGDHRVCRGGHWNYYLASACRSAWRGSGYADIPNNNRGFRLALSSISQ
jgi:formylglycine-generating enzyme required for sulfatase activity